MSERFFDVMPLHLRILLVAIMRFEVHLCRLLLFYRTEALSLCDQVSLLQRNSLKGVPSLVQHRKLPRRRVTA